MTQQEEDLVTRLAEEYKILQEKIDKIGAFRFTIKGWSITVIIGALFAGTAKKSINPWILLLGLAVLIGAFFYFEMEQARLSRSFGQRVINIERVISRILRTEARQAGSNDFLVLHFVPGIAHHLRGPEQRHRGPRSRWQILREAHIIFYLCLTGLILCISVWNVFSKPSGADTVIFNDLAAPGTGSLASTPAAVSASSASKAVGSKPVYQPNPKASPQRKPASTPNAR